MNKGGAGMPERSKRILFHDNNKISQINPENQKLMQKYEIDMSLRELSHKTIYAYQNDLEQWLIYILDHQFNQSVTELTDDDITEFLYYCKQQGNNVERMKRRMASISAFYKFLRKKRLIQENPTEFLDRPKKGLPVTVQTFLTKEQVELMKQKLTENGNTQLMTYALFSLSTMARVNAIANIKWNQIDFEERMVKGVLEKEGKIVDLFFSEEVKELLLKLKAEREENGVNDFDWVFFSGRNTSSQAINTGTLNEWCKTIGKMIGVETLHPHDFRHSGATLLKNAGMQLEDVSALLNHQDTSTTVKHYLKPDKSRLADIKDKFNI